MGEVGAGHDGNWVTHPALVPLARGTVDTHMPGKHQQHGLRADVQAGRDDLLHPPRGRISRAGFDNNVEARMRHLAAWLDGHGCAQIHGLMGSSSSLHGPRLPHDALIGAFTRRGLPPPRA